MQAPTLPLVVGTTQVAQAPKPQVIMRSIETWQATSAARAWSATACIMGSGPQVITTS